MVVVAGLLVSALSVVLALPVVVDDIALMLSNVFPLVGVETISTFLNAPLYLF